MDGGLIFGVLLALPVALIVVLVALIPIAIRAERARKAHLRDWATAHGWTFLERSRAPWTERLPGRNSRGLGITMTGPLGGRWVTVAEYSYQTTSSSGYSSTTYSTTTTTTHRFFVILVLLDRMYPPVEVLPRGLFSKLGRAIFGDKPTATGNVLFDSRYRIATADPRCAEALIGPRLINAHITGAVPPWSLVGNELLTYIPTSGDLRDPTMIPGYAAPLLRVADLLGH
ncbi:hypothetical protein ACRS6B_05145 [Nocardia asteroides]